MTDAARTIAIETLCEIGLHKSFLLPASALPNAKADAQPLRITYSDLGYRPPPNENKNNDLNSTADHNQNNVVTDSDSDPSEQCCVVLFISGLLGGRWTLCRSAAIARRLKIRLISIDRPSLGGSTPVPISQRLAVQLAAAPALLNHLGIKHVTLASHSGGAPYLLATVLAHRGLLHPKRPHVVLLAPFVHPRDGGALLMRITAALPPQAISKFHFLATAINRTFAFSVSGLGNRPTSDKPAATAVAPSSETGEKKTDELPQSHGSGSHKGDLEKAVQAEMDHLAAKYMFAENIQGSSEDALLFLRKHINPITATTKGLGNVEGKDWLDYPTIAKAIAEQENHLHSGHADTVDDSEKLRIDALHSEKDIMSGVSGAKHFDDCWATPVIQSNISFHSKIMKGTNHDSIVDPKLGVSEIWLQNVAQRWYG
jgi:pimeloyl-ACP methyl ester carboxylesterase